MRGLDTGEVVRRAWAVLDANRRGDWTCPSARLYPHQWLWDSCFVSIGTARDAPRRAADELASLLRAQWADGMLPHLVFADARGDIGSRTVWRSWRRPGAPAGIATSCVTQPPVAAVAAERVARALPDDERAVFLATVVPRLVAYHRWLYRARDLGGTGLVTLIHPWECGLDSTPPWMRLLREWRMPAWLRAAQRLRLGPLLRRLRYDTRHLPAAERVDDDDGLRMLALVVRDARYRFERLSIPTARGVLVEDLAFSAILTAANRALTMLAEASGTVLPGALTDAMHRTADAVEALLWDETTGGYRSRDARSGELLPERTVAGLLPLFGGTPSPARAARLAADLHDDASWGAPHPVPSVPLDAPEFRERRYWQGPTWVNTNWMIVEGLRAYGFADEAADLGDRTVRLVAESGFAEYFSPLTGAPLGALDFSWTAALTIDLARGAS